MKGAEAVITKSTFQGKPCFVKERIPKEYRIEELDLSLRKRRTKREAKLLKKAVDSGIRCPEVFEISQFSIKFSIIKGKRPEETKENMKKAAEILAKLHSINIIHGDFTFANLLLSKGKMHVIDFGLGSFSHKIEHKAIDVFTMFLSLHDKGLRAEFFESYLRNSKDKEKIKERLERISQRVRYS